MNLTQPPAGKTSPVAGVPTGSHPPGRLRTHAVLTDPLPPH
jgi:hypothetical protein